MSEQRQSHRGDDPTTPLSDLETLHQSEDEAGSPAPPDRTAIEAGTLIADRYRVIRFIARGGMGEVYEAEDLELHGRVALKTIRPEIGERPKVIDRFKREIQLARKVTHPNVCRVFDIGRHRLGDRDIYFVTMELLEGSTLRDTIIRRGPLSTDTALPLVKQMAEALDAAHRAGIIHRDFKSSNVVMVPEEDGRAVRAVVTDFGLARSLAATELDVSLSNTGQVLGTPAYMAPEQVEGKPVTPATDIYALGLVIYELVTGRLPFSGDTPIAVALKRLQEQAPSPRLLVPTLDNNWERTILRCLERNPQERFASAVDVVRSLIGEQVAGSRRHRRAAVAAAATVLTVLAGAAAIWMQRAEDKSGETQPAVKARRSVAVLGFKNLSQQADVSWLSTALSEMLSTELAGGDQMRAVSGETVARMKMELGLTESDSYSRETLARMRKILDTDYVVVGSFVALSGADKRQIRMDVKVQETAGGNVLQAIAESGTEDKLFELMARVGTRLRATLGLNAAPGTTPAALPSTVSAARYYAEGLAKARQYDNLTARDLLERAIAEDAEFPLAHSELADVYHDLGYDQKAHEHAEAALRLSSALPRESRLVIEAQKHSLDRQHAQAAEINRALWRFYPDNLEYGLALAMSETYAGKGREGLQLVESLKKTWDDPRIDVAEAEIAEFISDYKRAAAVAKVAAQKADSRGQRLIGARARLFEGWALARMSDGPNARTAFEDARKRYEAVGDRNGISQALSGIGTVFLSENNFAAAKEAFEMVRRVSIETGNREGEGDGLSNLALVSMREGDAASARKNLTTAIAIHRAAGGKHSVANTLDLLGGVEWSAGNLNDARKLYEEALAINREIGARRAVANNMNNLAIIANQQGDLPRAEKMMREVEAAFREIGDPAAAADVMNNLAVLLRTRGDLAGAEKMYNEAARTYRALDKKSDIAMVNVNLASLLIDRGDLVRARKNFEEALATWRSTGERGYAAYALMGLADVQLKGGALADAEKNVRLTLEERTALGETGPAAESMVGLAEVLLEQGRLDEAEKFARDAFRAFEAQQHPDGQALAKIVSCRVALARNDLSGARRRLAEAKRAAASGSDASIKTTLIITEARLSTASGAESSAIESLNGQASNGAVSVASRFEARLALAEAKLSAQRRAEALKDLAALQAEASKSGFNLVAQKAARLAAAPSA